MADKQSGSTSTGAGFSRFAGLGASLRQSAQELSAKAAASVNEINAKVALSASAAVSGSTSTTDDASTPAAAASTPSNSVAQAAAQPQLSIEQLKSDDSVSKDDVLEILQKRSRQMKTLLAIRQQLTERAETAELQASRLESLLKDEILNGFTPTAPDQDAIPQYQAAWRNLDEQHAQSLHQIQSEFQKLQRQQIKKEQNNVNGNNQNANNEEWNQLKQQLEGHHVQELVQLKESLGKQHQLELEEALQKQQQAISSSSPATSPSSCGEEVEKLRTAFAAYKKKFAALHASSVEKSKAELRAAVQQREQELAQLQQEHARQMEALKLEHVAAAATATAQASSDGSTVQQQQQALLDQAQQQLDLLRREHAAELQRVKDEDAAQRLEEMNQTRQVVEQTVTTEMEEKLQEVMGGLKQKHQAQLENLAQKAALERDQAVVAAVEVANAAWQKKITALEQRHLEQQREAAQVNQQKLQEQSQSSVEAVKSELEAQASEKINALQQQLEQAKERHTQTVESIKAQLEERSQAQLAAVTNEKESALAEMTASIQKEREMLAAAYAAETERLRAELEAQRDQFQEAVAAAKQEGQARTIDIESAANAHAAALQKQLDQHTQAMQALKTELEERSKAQLSAATKEKDESLAQMNASFNQSRETMEAKLAAETERLTTALEAQQLQSQEALAAAESRHGQAVASLEKDLVGKFKGQAAAIQQKHASQLEQANESSRMALQQALDAARDEATANFNKVRDELSVRVSSLETELQSKNQSENRYMGQVQELQSKLQALADEKAAISAAATDGETSSNQKLEEALSQQRVSYDQMLENLRQQHKAELDAKIQEMQQTATARDQQQQAQHDDEVQRLKSQVEDGSARISHIVERHETEMTALKSQLEESRSLLQQKRAALDETAKRLDAGSSESQAALDETRRRLSVLEKERGEQVALLQKEAEELKENFELKLKESSLRETSLAERLESLQAIHETQVKKLADDLKEKLEGWEKEKADLLAASQADKEGLAQSTQQQLKALQDALQAKDKQFQEVSSELKGLSGTLGKEQDQLNSLLQQRESKITSLESELDTAREQLLSTRDATGQDFESRLVELQEKHAAEKQMALADHAAALLKFREEYETERSKLEEDVTVRLHGQHQTELEKLQVALQASEKQLQDISSESRDLSKKLSKELDDLKSLLQGRESKITELESELDNAREQLLSTQGASGEDFESRLSEIQEKHAAEKQKALADHEAALQKIKEEYESQQRKLEEDMASRMQGQQAELSEQLSTQANKFIQERDEMRKSMEVHIDKMKAHFLGKLETTKAESATEMQQLQQQSQVKDDKLAKLVDRLKALTAGTANLRTENEELKKKLDSESKIQNALRSDIQSVKNEMNNTVVNSSATAESLLQQQETLEAEKTGLQQQLAELKRERDMAANKVEELSGKLNALTTNLNAVAADRKILEERLQVAARNEVKLNTSEAEISDLREQINKLKLEMTQNANLVNRLQAEKDANERSQGQRTALVGMLEAKLSEVNDKNADLNAKLEASLYDLSQKDEAIQSSAGDVRKLEKDLAEARSATRRATEALASAHKGAEAKTSKTVDSLQKELQLVKQQMARKSAAAQRLVQEREAECAQLRKDTMKLQQEVDKGSLSDRKIFELAAKQSNRESYQATEVEIRNKALETMQNALIQRDSELATAEKNVEEFKSQVEELCRARRREDVSLDYLKSIVVQYLSLPPGSTERASLLPVLATLLQFNSQDYQVIEEGKNRLSWWGNVAPTTINAPTNPIAPIRTGSAEVSVSATQQGTASSQQSGNQTRGTSLQF